MKDKKTAVDEAFRAIYTEGTATLAGEVEKVLEDLWDAASERAGFDHQMAVLAYQFARAIDVTGPGVVAERLGISVKELAERIQPDRMGDMTMSEQRLLALCVGVELSYDVFMPKEVTTDV